jgi:hypothetical protein
LDEVFEPPRPRFAEAATGAAESGRALVWWLDPAS